MYDWWWWYDLQLHHTKDVLGTTKTTTQPTNKQDNQDDDGHSLKKKTKPSIAWEPTLLKKINLEIGWIKSKHSNAQDG